MNEVGLVRVPEFVGDRGQALIRIEHQPFADLLEPNRAGQRLWRDPDGALKLSLQLSAGDVAEIRQLLQPKLPLPEMEHLRRRLDPPEIHRRGKQLLDDVILDDGHGGIVVVRAHGRFDLGGKVGPFTPERRPKIAEAVCLIGKQGHGAPREESR